MPELPDIVAYIGALKARLLNQPLENVRVSSPFLLRSVTPALTELKGRRVCDIRRLGKRIVLCLEDELFVVIHLMIAGRLHWKEPRAKINARIGLAAFDFPSGTLVFTEAGSKKRTSLYFVRGKEALREHDRGGLEVLECKAEDFAEALTRENHSLKRSLTDPRLFSGIGNAYSDEILHRAKLSPLKMTLKLTPEEIERLFSACREILTEWAERLSSQAGLGFPEAVTAFRPEMAVHGRFKQPCPVCNSPVQRIVYAENEANYCATCQTGGKLLADRAMSRLLKKDWPKTLEELEEKTAALRAGRGA